MDRVEREVTAIIARALSIETAKVAPDTALEQLGLDSIDVTMIVFEIEATFNVQFPGEFDQAALVCVGDVVRIVKKLRAH